NGVGKEKGVVLEFVPIDSLTKAETDVKAGEQVDMVQAYFAGIDTDRDTLGIQAFEDVFPQSEMDAHFAGIPENCLNLGKIDGKMYGLAFTFSTPMLYVNATLLEEAGIDPTTAPADWDELYDWCKTVKEQTGKYGLALSPSNSTGWVTDSILYSNGAQVLSDDRTECVFASEEGIKAFTTWKKFYTDGVAVGGSDGDAMQSFLAGEAAMHIQSTSVYTAIKSTFEQAGWELTGYPMPGFDGKDSVPTNSGSAIVVRPDSEKKAQAIWEVIKYVTGDEGYTIITSQIGYLPLRPYLADDENYLKGFVDENPIIRQNIERLQYVQPATIWPGEHAAELRTLYSDMAVKALTTDADVAETMKEYQDQMNQYISG
ncbi:MAG: ABC transporter substrate-binding protein, partial [Oscillospiraceae bacterium]